MLGREHALEAGDVEDAHVFLLDVDQARGLELGEQAADGLELQAEIAAQLLARHAQVEVRRRVAAAHEPLGEAEQEGGEALLGAHRAQQQHDAVVAYDFARQHRVQAALQRRHFLRHLLDQRVGEHADLAVLQRDRGAVVAARAQAVEADQLAAHEEAGDLLAALAVEHARLEEAAADRVHRVELRAAVEQHLAALHAPAGIHDVLDALEVFHAQRSRQAQLAQVAARATHLELRGGGTEALGGLDGDHGWHGVSLLLFAGGALRDELPRAAQFPGLVEEIARSEPLRELAVGIGGVVGQHVEVDLGRQRAHRAQHVEAAGTAGEAEVEHDDVGTAGEDVADRGRVFNQKNFHAGSVPARRAAPYRRRLIFGV